MEGTKKAGIVDFYALSPVRQAWLGGATARFAQRAMMDPVLWARVQSYKEQMYADGRLQREVETDGESHPG